MSARAVPALALLILAACWDPERSLPPLVQLRLEPPRVSARVGERIQLRALAGHRDGSVEDVTPRARWTAISGAGSAEADGGVRGASPGTMVVEARWEGRTARATVDIGASPPAVKSLALVPSSATSRPGGAVAFRAEATMADGTVRDVSSEVEWSVEPAGVGHFDRLPPGMVELDRSGSAEVRASLEGRSARATLRAVDPEPSRPEFPVRLSTDHRFLVDGAGRPFRVQGDSAWSFIAALDEAEAERYLADRERRGFDALVVNLLEHRFAPAAPKNRRGDPPFDPPGDLGHPVDAYFDAARDRVHRAGEHGMLVFLVPAYLGYGCPRTLSPANEGWSAELDRTPPDRCRAYGRYVGARFRSERNVVWVEGGDCTPPPGSGLERCSLEVLSGIREADPQALQTGHFRPNSDSLDEDSFAPEMSLTSVYRYRTPATGCRRAYAREPARPAYLLETGYEHENIQAAAGPIRQLLASSSLSCTAGVVFGSRPLWLFGPGWEQDLDSPATRDVERLGRLLDALPWQRLVPSSLGGMRQLVTAGQGLAGTTDRVRAAATPEGDLLLAYVPPGGGGPRSIVVDTAGLAGPATARWFSPGTGTFVPVGQILPSGRRWFTTPGGPAREDDWLLVVEVS